MKEMMMGETMMMEKGMTARLSLKVAGGLRTIEYIYVRGTDSRRDKNETYERRRRKIQKWITGKVERRVKRTMNTLKTRDKLIQELQNLKVETVKDVIDEMKLEERIRVLNKVLGV